MSHVSDGWKSVLETVRRDRNANGLTLVAAWWWSRGDDLGNLELGRILERAGVRIDMSDAASVDWAVRAVATEPESFDELADWCELIAHRWQGSSTSDPHTWLSRTTSRLIERMSSPSFISRDLEDALQQVVLIDDALRAAAAVRRRTAFDAAHRSVTPPSHSTSF
ncbi:hypothetical protein ABH922_001240 [Rhodococcus sp. 27YEA15]|uniref:hypothetical protein n=1 Tax=Rhodococcus sp. 27YEA15 TaxID=3156259 RepID=UPI003C79D7D5